jgi:cyclopropane-fatty-acyl-phospholipid synthase
MKAIQPIPASSLSACPARSGSWARRLVHSQFGCLRGAGLILDEGAGACRFGDPAATLQARIEVRDPRFYRRLILGGSIGAAEAWVDGDWDSPELTAVIRVLARNMAVLEGLERRLGWLGRPAHWLRHRLSRNSRAGSRANIAAHYDLGDDLYARFLDPYMQYSSAIFPAADACLATAQENKLRLICERLDLRPADHLLEIGTGWGGLACFAARHYGCRVTTTTISPAQYAHACQRVARAGLADRVTVLAQDYRDLRGVYDKLVSVEMIEAVGHAYLPAYFRTLDRLLKPCGRMLLQAITITDQRYDAYRSGVDFIQRYIFPGGCLPSVSEMCRHLKEQTSLSLVRLHSYGCHYAHTLRLWSERFQAVGEELRALGYGDDFQRLWAFYFAYCEGGFSEGAINLVHFEAARHA